MRTLLLVIGVWTAASILLAVSYALGAAVGYRRAIDDTVRRATRPDGLSDDVESLRR